ncbi:MAG: response regulator, partial [Chloroflexi bacterium]|nr:response regulator [Chloroflexota bacterium]
MKERILVVDDDEKITNLLRRALSYEGYVTDIAHDGPKALGLALEHHPDLVILDVMLPGMDGLEVCRRLREGGDEPILMLTARDEVSDRVMGLDSGADDYVVKPFALEELMA